MTCKAGRDIVEMISDDPNLVDQINGSRRRTMSLGSKKSRSGSVGGSNGNDLRRKTLHFQAKRSLDESTQQNSTQ